MSDLASSSFEFYDGIRILLSGAIVTAIYTAIVETFALGAPLPTGDALIAITVVIVSGMFMYFLDIAGGSVIYRAKLPHRELEAWTVTPPRGVTMRNIYFLLLDTRMPPGLRNRTYYYGQMFRIGFDLIVLFGLSTIAVVVAAVLCTYTHGAVSGDPAQPVMIAGSALLGGVVVWALAAAWFRTGLVEGQSRTRAMLSRLGYQIPWCDRLLLILMAASGAVFACWGFAPALITAGTVGNCLWIFRYVRGALLKEHRGSGLSLRDRLDGRRRRNIDAASATLLLCGAALAVWLPTSIRSSSGTHLSSGAAVGWTLGLLTAAILMLMKAHEGKLWGSHYTVIAWLTLHRNEIIDAFGLTDRGTPRPDR